MKNREGEPKGLDLVCKPFKKNKMGYKPVKTSLIIPYSEIESVCVCFIYVMLHNHRLDYFTFW